MLWNMNNPYSQKQIMLFSLSQHFVDASEISIINILNDFQPHHAFFNQKQ